MRQLRYPLCVVVLLVTLMLPIQADTTTVAKPEIGSWLFGGLRARAIGPAVMGGRISAMDVVAADPRIIYVGAAGGGIWKSQNAGTTFKPIFDKYAQSIGAITVDQAHPDTVWVGTGEVWVRNSVSVGTGLYRTTDGGETWEQIAFQDSERIGKIIIDPTNSEIIYVAVLGHLWNANEERGLYKSSDFGETWNRVLHIDENTGCADIAIDPQEPNIIYASMWQFRRQPDSFKSGGPGSGIWRSTDGGENWKALSKGLPEGELGRIALAVAPSRPSVIYANVEAKETAMYRSINLGETWIKMGSDANVKSRPFYFSLVVVDPDDFDRVYKPATWLSVSKDGGKTWCGTMGAIHPDIHAFWVNPNDPSHLIAGTDGGIYVSYDRGGHTMFLNNLPVSQFYHVSCDTKKPYNVYGGLQDNGSWYGPSQSPAGIENRDWQTVGYGDGFNLIRDPLDENIIFWQYQGGRLFRHYESTGENKDIKPMRAEGEPEFRFNWNTPVEIGPSTQRNFYVGAQFLFLSTDRGDSWKKISPDLTTNDPKKQRQATSGGLTIDNSTAENHCSIYSISESPLDARLIWVGTDDGNLQMTTDGGKSWTNVVSNIPDLPEYTWCSSVETSRYDRMTAYVTFDGHRTGDMNAYLYKTTNLGESWQSLATDDIKGYLHVVREDLVNRDLLYLGTEFGLFVSIDGGEQWVQFKEDFPPASVRDIVIHPNEPDLVLATHGRGIYIIDDITPLRQVADTVLASKVHLFKPDPVVLVTRAQHQQFSGSGNFVGDNPSEVAKITYYLSKRHIFGDLKVEVYNQDGELLKSLPGGKRKGINVVDWYMRKKPPRVAQAGTLAGAALFGPTLPEGKYGYKLIKGKAEYAGTIELIADPDSPHSKEDRLLQQKTVLNLYDMQARLAYITATVSEARDDANQHAESLKKGDRLRKKLESFAEKLDDLYSSIVVAEQKPGITGERKLREKVVELYGSISGYGGRPTDSQLRRMSFLAGEIEKANDRFESITAKDLTDLNSQLEKKKLKPMRLLTREEFDKRES